jgi:hypothetical protein
VIRSIRTIVQPKQGLTESAETGALFKMVSRMMQAEAIKNKDVNIVTLMNILGRYYQIRDDYLDITGTLRLPPFQYILPFSHFISSQ